MHTISVRRFRPAAESHVLSGIGPPCYIRIARTEMLVRDRAIGELPLRTTAEFMNRAVKESRHRATAEYLIS